MQLMCSLIGNCTLFTRACGAESLALFVLALGLPVDDFLPVTLTGLTVSLTDFFLVMSAEH